MFTIQQIKDAHSKVKSGKDFPTYVQDLVQLGVTSYDTFVSDGHTDYFGTEGFKISSDAKYAPLAISSNSDATQFNNYLKIHQQGLTDYPTFCAHCAETGVEKWSVDTDKMTCTYYDADGNEMLQEMIPA